jgi:hypothetical protein
MKAQPQPKKLNVRRTFGAPTTERSMMFEEQIASTSTASEHAWLLVVLGLIVLTIGLYWFSDRQSDQPAWSYQALVEDQAGEQPGEFVISDQITTGPENLTMPWPEALTPIPMPNPRANERLVRRVYDEVINQQQFAVMDDLFAERVTYRRTGSPITLGLAALKQEIIDESTGYTGVS